MENSKQQSGTNHDLNVNVQFFYHKQPTPPETLMYTVFLYVANKLERSDNRSMQNPS